MDQNKKEIRQRMVTLRNTMPEDQRTHSAYLACTAIMQEAAWNNATAIGAYVAFGAEMNTKLLLDAAWSSGKHVFLPRCLPPKGHMEFIQCAGWDELTPDSYGILAPSGQQYLSVPLPRMLFIVPGVAYDGEGHRLGWGGGYYDRYFSRPAMQPATLMGFCYAHQVVQSLPHEHFDVSVSAIATEKGITWLK